MPEVASRQRIVGLELPAPLGLMPYLLHAVGEWHTEDCDVEGCRVSLRGTVGGITVIQHGVPDASTEAVSAGDAGR